jgi:hypothetical protein
MRRARRALSVASVLAVIAGTLLLAPAAQAAFGFLPGPEGFNVTATERDGSIDNQAGSHPFELSTTVNFKLAAEPPAQPGGPYTDGDVRDLHIEMPPGLVENPAALTQCSQVQFHTPRSSPFEKSLSGESCPADSQIGVVAVHTGFGSGGTRTFGVFNLAPPPGSPSQFGFSPFGTPITLTPHVREANGEYGLTLDLLNFSQKLAVFGFKLTLWGTPWSLSHNAERGNCLNEAEPAFPWAKCSVGPPRIFTPKAYLTLPSACTGPLAYALSADSWQQPAVVGDSFLSADAEGHPQGLEGCAALPFDPSPVVRLSTDRASSATGLDFVLEGNSEGLLDPEKLAASQTRKAVVTLPAGMTINPSVGAGLGVCTPSSYAAETISTPAGVGCPDASKIGEISVESPLFEGPVGGGLFLAQPDNPATTTPGAENPFDSLLALYFIAKAPDRGVMVKVAGRIGADAATGQLTATFDGLPQLPYSHFHLLFRPGQRSPLITPPACGVYSTQVDLAPWLDPAAVRHDAPQFQLSAGIAGSACPAGTPPFTPGAQAGTLNRNAGSYTPFYLHLTRTDAEQEITSYSAQLPPGLLGKIAGIPYCSEADIAAARRESGVEETEHPSCPAASRIGHTVAGYGVGSVLAYAPGELYLAGPFHGAPFSIVAIDSATVGPFDLGVIVVRSAIKVDPRTAQVSVDSAGSDPIPHIVNGIPLHLRDIRVYMNRPGFTVNPTRCEPFSVVSSLTGSSAPFSNPADVAALAAVHFQVSNCSSLGFLPKLSLRLKGGNRRGDYPSLRATVLTRSGDANIGKAAVTLPPTEFLAQNHIDTICTRPQLEREACPGGSVYGHARAFTPLLEEPMDGSVYLSSSGNPLPDLVAVLHGHGLTIVVDGRIDSVHGGLRASFEGLPDAPVSKFVMTLNGGKRGLLVNERNPCSVPAFATARLIGQNNLGALLKPRLEATCSKHSKRRAAQTKKRGTA